MRIKLIVLIVLLKTNGLFSQKTDVIKLENYSQSECNSELDARRLSSRIVNQTKIADTTYLEIAYSAACCMEFKPVVFFMDDTLYIRVYDENQTGCFCSCCYTTTLKIVGINASNYTVKLDGQTIKRSDEIYKVYPIEFTMYKGDTINRKDKYGLRQGIWKMDYNNDFMGWKDDNLKSWGELFDNGKIKTEYDAVKKVKRYFSKSGKIKKEVYDVNTNSSKKE